MVLHFDQCLWVLTEKYLIPRLSQVVNGKWWISQVIIMVTGVRLTPPLPSETINQLLGGNILETHSTAYRFTRLRENAQIATMCI